MFTLWESAHILKQIYLDMVKEVLEEDKNDEQRMVDDINK